MCLDPNRCRIGNNDGFTLLEVVVVIVLVAIVGSMLFGYVRSAVDHTGQQLSMARDTLVLQQAMEDVTSRYKRRYQNLLDAGIQPADVSILSDFKAEAAGALTGRAVIDTANTRFVTFSRDADTKTYTIAAYSDTEQSGAHLLMVIRAGGQRVMSVFSDSDQ